METSSSRLRAVSISSREHLGVVGGGWECLQIAVCILVPLEF